MTADVEQRIRCGARFIARGSLLFATFLVASAPSLATTTMVDITSSRIPVQGNGRSLGAQRPIIQGHARKPASVAGTSAWHQQATLRGAVIHDLAFPSAAVGYAAAELGQVWKTDDGGATWTRIMNLGFPYYWYGVYAYDEQDLVISGFNNSTSAGIIRWSHDGGATWSDDVELSATAWAMRIRYSDNESGLVMDLVDTTAPNRAHVTSDGGALAADWDGVVVDQDGGWFGAQFSLLPGGHARASGITYCDSTTAGATWACGPSVDAVFDGPTFFVDEDNGWVAGGSISPDVEGWVHHTTDAGQTWSDRTLDVPWPIRELLFVSPQTGWAAGGNIYSGTGGIYASTDGGETWTLDLDSAGYELDACANFGQTVWCAGYDSAFNGVVFSRALPIEDRVFGDGFDGAP